VLEDLPRIHAGLGVTRCYMEDHRVTGLDLLPDGIRVKSRHVDEH
jgi:hypothetical protein